MHTESYNSPIARSHPSEWRSQTTTAIDPEVGEVRERNKRKRQMVSMSMKCAAKINKLFKDAKERVSFSLFGHPARVSHESISRNRTPEVAPPLRSRFSCVRRKLRERQRQRQRLGRGYLGDKDEGAETRVMSVTCDWGRIGPMGEQDGRGMYPYARTTVAWKFYPPVKQGHVDLPFLPHESVAECMGLGHRRG